MEVREKVSNEDLQAYLKTLVEKSKVAQKRSNAIIPSSGRSMRSLEQSAKLCVTMAKP